VYCLNCQEAFFHGVIASVDLLIREEYIRSDDGGEIVDVHLAARLFVNNGKGSGPVEEAKQDFHGVSMCFR